MSIFTSRKFRVDMLAIYSTLFLVSILGITYYFYSRSNEAIIKVADGFISRTNDSIAQELNNFLQPTPLFSIANLIMNDSKLDNLDMETLASYMHVVLQSYPQLINAYIADNNGNLFIENHVVNKPLDNQLIPFVKDFKIPADTTYISAILTPQKNEESVKFIFKNKFGMILGKSDSIDIKFDPRLRPWYQHAKDNGKMMWIGIYPFYATEDQVITIAFPIYSHNRFMGVAAADLNLTSIRAAINRFSKDTGGIVFIANQNGKMISGEKYTSDVERGARLSTIEASKSEIIKRAYNIFTKRHLNHFIFTLDNVRYIAQFKTYSISGGEEWQIATVIPLDIFVGSINRANRNALIFSVVTLLLGLILVVWSSNRMSDPIIKIAEETKDMQHFNFSKPTKIKSHIYEVQVMVNALNIAKSALYSFSKYVPKLLVDQLLRMGNIAAPGGEKRTITILFSDIVGFTNIAEQMEPNVLMLQLSEYLDALTKRIHANNGNIDKYIGDSIMAFWGAPHDDAEQIQHACQALLDCKRELQYMNARWREEGKPVLATRFGLNTGLAIVGNLGSSDRLNYTAIGDTVNLASRLEAVNKQYGTESIVSEAIYKVCHRQFLFRPIDSVQVPGKSGQIIIYEIMASLLPENEYAATDAQLSLCETFTRGYDLYHGGDIQQAKAIFTELVKAYPEDHLSQLYLKRCQEQVV